MITRTAAHNTTTIAMKMVLLDAASEDEAVGRLFVFIPPPINKEMFKNVKNSNRFSRLTGDYGEEGVLVVEADHVGDHAVIHAGVGLSRVHDRQFVPVLKRPS